MAGGSLRSVPQRPIAGSSAAGRRDGAAESCRPVGRSAWTLLRAAFIAISVLSQFGLAGGTSAQADDPPIPIDAFWQQVASLRSLLGDLDDLGMEEKARRFEEAAGAWERTTAATLEGGAILPIDSSEWVRLLRTDPVDVDALQEKFGALEEMRVVWPAESSVPLNRGLLEQILARPEFQYSEETKSPLGEWLGSISDRLRGFLARILGGREIALAIRSPLGMLATGIAVVLLLAVLALVARGLISGWVAAEELVGPQGESLMTSQSATREAERFMSASDFRTAIRYLYLAALLRLEEAGLFRYDRTLTNREVLQSLSHMPAITQPLGWIVQEFERVWYGFQTVDQAAYTECVAKAEQLRRQV